MPPGIGYPGAPGIPGAPTLEDDLVAIGGGAFVPRSVAESLGLGGGPMTAPAVPEVPPPAIQAPPVVGAPPLPEMPARDADVLAERETELAPDLGQRQQAAAQEAAAAEEARRAAGTGAPLTPQNLMATTYGDVLAERNAALDAEAGAAKDTAAVESAKAKEVAAAFQERNAAMDALQKEREAKLLADQNNLTKTQNELASAQKALADKKIDRARLWNDMGTGKKILVGISVALSGLGSALKHEGDKNPALDMVLSAIQNDVELQFKERDALAQDVEMKRGMIDVAMQTSNHRQAQYQLAMAGYTEKAARDVEAIAAAAEEPLAAARAKEFAAQLRQKGADFLGQAVQLEHSEWQAGQDRLQRERDSKRQVGVQYARIKEDRRQFDKNLIQRQAENALNYDLKLQEMAADREAAAAELLAKGGDAASKQAAEIRARGVPDLKLGDSMYMARDDKTATTVATRKASVDTVVNLADELIRLRDKHGGEADAARSEAWRKMKANEASIKNALRTAEEMGALDKGSLEVLGNMMGTNDVTEFNTRLSDAAEGLIQMRKNVLGKFNDYAKGVRDPLAEGEYQDYSPAKRFREKGPNASAADKAYEVLVSEKTPDEKIRGAEPGAGTKAVGDLFYMGDRPDTNQQKAAKGEAAADNDPEFGSMVTKKQGQALRTILAKAKGEGNEATEARDILLDIAADSSRPELANATARALLDGFGAETLDAAAERTSNKDWKETLGQLKSTPRIETKGQRGKDVAGQAPNEKDKALDKFKGKSSDYTIAGKAEPAPRSGYQPDPTDFATMKRAKAGDQGSIDQLLSMVTQGGDRALWASKALVEIGNRKKK